MRDETEAVKLLEEINQDRGRSVDRTKYGRKLTPDQVRLVREVYRLAFPNTHGLGSALARRFKVSTQNMHCVLRGQSYKWVK
jgi:hypothetical protein